MRRGPGPREEPSSAALLRGFALASAALGAAACTTEDNFEERLLEQQQAWAESCGEECPNESVIKGVVVDEAAFTTWACVDYFSFRDALDAHCYRYDDAAAADCIKIFQRLNREETCDAEHEDMEALREACLGAYVRDCLTEALETE